MEVFDPKESFGHDVSKRYDNEDARGDEEQTVRFLAAELAKDEMHSNSRSALAELHYLSRKRAFM